MSSASKQRICRDFVRENIYCCMTDIMNDLIDAEKVDYYSLVSEYVSCQKKRKQDEDEEYDLDEDAEFDNIDIFEWWAVGDYLATKLEEHGELVCRDYMVPIWGRQCCGQAIYIDSVIEEICAEIGILENDGALRND